MKGNTFQLPTLIECGRIPSAKKEIPSPDLLYKFSHLRDISSEIPPIDPNTKIHLLISRDAPKRLTVRAFKNGLQGAPWAHKLLLGWTVSGQICVYRLGGLVHVQAHRTVCIKNNDMLNHPTDLNADVVPCTNHIQSDDNEKAMSIDDRRFLNIMEKSIQKNDQGIGKRLCPSDRTTPFSQITKSRC